MAKRARVALFDVAVVAKKRRDVREDVAISPFPADICNITFGS